MAYYDNSAAIASWERKWLDPDYDMANGRYYYYDDEDEDDEDEFVDDEIDDSLNYIFGLER